MSYRFLGRALRPIGADQMWIYCILLSVKYSATTAGTQAAKAEQLHTQPATYWRSHAILINVKFLTGTLKLYGEVSA